MIVEEFKSYLQYSTIESLVNTTTTRLVKEFIEDSILTKREQLILKHNMETLRKIRKKVIDKSR